MDLKAAFNLLQAGIDAAGEFLQSDGSVRRDLSAGEFMLMSNLGEKTLRFKHRTTRNYVLLDTEHRELEIPVTDCLFSRGTFDRPPVFDEAEDLAQLRIIAAQLMPELPYCIFGRSAVYAGHDETGYRFNLDGYRFNLDGVPVSLPLQSLRTVKEAPMSEILVSRTVAIH